MCNIRVIGLKEGLEGSSATQYLSRSLSELTDCSFIVGADFNAVWDPNIDRSNAKATGEQARTRNALKSWANSLWLMDTWRAVNPTCKDYSFFSGRHKSFSRIHFLFASPHLFNSIDKAVLLPMALSDHKGVFCSTTLGRLSQRAARWRFNTSLLKNESCHTIYCRIPDICRN